MGVFDIVMEKPAEVSRGDGCVWQSLQNLIKSVSTMVVFDIVMEKPPEVSRGDGCVWHSHCKTCWSQSRRWVCDKVMEKPVKVRPSDGCVWYSHGKTCWRQSKRWMCLIYSWKNQLKSIEEMVVFDIVMAKPGEVSRGDGCVWYSHWKTCWSQSRRWMCLI